MSETGDPFVVLGLGADASADDVREARRRLAREHHPDHGGDAVRMREVNAAADAALGIVAAVVPVERFAPVDDARHGARPPRRGPGRAVHDVPSFTIEALPVEAFAALEIVGATLGDVLDDDPPYRLDCFLRAPFDCWCRLDVVPDAGSSTVSITVAGFDDAPAPDIVAVRDAWISDLNLLDW